MRCRLMSVGQRAVCLPKKIPVLRSTGTEGGEQREIEHCQAAVATFTQPDPAPPQVFPVHQSATAPPEPSH